MILIITLNPCIDKTIYVHENFLGAKIKAKKIKVIAGGKGNNVARILNIIPSAPFWVKTLYFLCSKFSIPTCPF